MNALNPVFKMIGILIPTLILAAVHNPLLNLLIFVVCLFLMLLSHVRIKILLLIFIPITLVAVGMFFTGYHFQAQSGAPVNADNLKMSDTAIWNGLTLGSRVLVYAALGFLFTLTTDKINLIRSLQQQLRLPSMFAYGLLAAWNIFPNMLEEYKKSRMSFRTKGINTSPISPTLLKPMLIKAILWSNALSIAMESKGFNGEAPRTEYYELKLSWKDISFPIITTSFIIFNILVIDLL